MPDSRTAYCNGRTDGGCSLKGTDGDYLTSTSTYAYFDGGPALSTAVDSLTGLTWSVEGDLAADAGVDWSSAVSACSSRGTGWSLPTAIELISLLDLGQPSGVAKIDPNFPGGAQQALYWTIDATGGDTPPGILVDFTNGRIVSSGVVGGSAPTAQVRCVQVTDSPSAHIDQALDAGNLVTFGVTSAFVDPHTQLQWAYLPQSVAFTGVGALNTCNNLSQDDCSDWRLPSDKELATILSFNGSSQVESLTAAWSSTAVPGQTDEVVLFTIGTSNLPTAQPQPSSTSESPPGLFCVSGP